MSINDRAINPESMTSPVLEHPGRRDWLLLTLLLLVLAAGLGWLNGLGRLDQSLYDKFVEARIEAAPDDIIIVAIDDYSLAQLGRWPWSRSMHATLIERLTEAKPRAIGLDILLSEAASADSGKAGDQALEHALLRNGRTVLPVALEDTGSGLSVRQPLAALASAASALGHIHLQLDGDGVVRSVLLGLEQDGRWWPTFALALLDASQIGDSGRPTAQMPQDTLRHLPFRGRFRTVPYVSVLRGEVPPQFFTDKYVLVGATAAGMADAFPTPVSGRLGILPGVEIHANILASLQSGSAIRIASPWQTMLLSMLPVLIGLLAYLYVSPRLSLLINAGLLILTLALSYLALRAGFCLPPAAALLCLLASYPLWSWRRLEAAIAYLDHEFIRLNQEPHYLPETTSGEVRAYNEDVLQQRIHRLQQAAQRVRDLRQFIAESLDSLPDASLVIDLSGQVLLANRQASAYFASCGISALPGAQLPVLLAGLNAPQTPGQPERPGIDWCSLLDLHPGVAHAGGIEVRDGQGRDLLIQSAPCHSATRTLTGWIISMFDLSAIRSAERSRDQSLNFLSHDMRAPQASILALLELQQDPASALPEQEFFSRLEKASRKTLDLADNFVQLARAESQQYHYQHCDLQDILQDATDEMWALAHGKQIRIVSAIAAAEYPVMADRALLARAICNLLSNAIKYSPAHTCITCTLQRQETGSSSSLLCSISDQGVGIAAADCARLFRRFQRIDNPEQGRQDGVGLGLLLVKTVLERHHGTVEVASKVGSGSTFTITLPAGIH